MLRLGGRGLLVFTEGHADRVTTEQALMEATGSEPRLFPGKASPRGGTGGVLEGWQEASMPGSSGQRGRSGDECSKVGLERGSLTKCGGYTEQGGKPLRAFKQRRNTIG